MAEFGLCACGCGETTPIAKMTDKRRGYKKGEHTRFRPGHVQRTMGKAAVIIQTSNVGGHEITQADIEALRTGDDGEAARVLDQRARAIERVTRHHFIELGLIGFEMRERGLWKKLEDPVTRVIYHSWEAWVTSALNVSASSAFAAVKVIEATKDTKGVEVEDLKDMTRRNVTQFARLSSKVQTKMVDKAKTLKEADFVAAVQNGHPDQHLDKAPAVHLNLEPNARKNWDLVIEIAKWVYDVERTDDAVENLLAFFLEGLCERQGYVKQTNRDAYRMAKKRNQV